MEVVKLPIGTPSKYFLTQNGSVVKLETYHTLVFTPVDYLKVHEGVYVNYNSKGKHISGNHIDKDKGLDIICPCEWLNDKIKRIECNIYIGQEFTFVKEQPRITVGKKYKVNKIEIFEDNSYALTFFNDRDQPQSVYDLNEIVIRKPL